MLLGTKGNKQSQVQDSNTTRAASSDETWTGGGVHSPKDGGTFGKRVQHRTMPWVFVQNGEDTLEIDDEFVVQNFGVPKDLLFNYVQKEIKDELHFLSLPFTMVLVLIFSWCCINHDHAPIIGDVEDAISTDLNENAVFAYTNPGWMGHKTLTDVHNMADVFSWLRIGLTPLLFKKHRIWSELTPGAAPWPARVVPKEERPMYLLYNRLIGGVEITQLRGEQVECPNPEISTHLRLSCVPGEDEVGLNLNVELEPFDIKAADVPVDTRYTIFLLVGEDLDNVGFRLRQMEMSSWLDNVTVVASANFMTYNAHFDTLSYSSAMFLFSRSGRVWKKLVHSSFVLNQYASWLPIFLDAIFAAMGLSVLFSEIREVFTYYKRYQKNRRSIKQLAVEYFEIWNLIDWLSLVVGVVFGATWVVHNWNLWELKQQLLGVVDAEHLVNNVIDELNVEGRVHKFYSTFRHTLHQYHGFRVWVAFFPLILCLRLFKSFHAQPKLSLLLRTLHKASNDILHFGLVFVATFMSFTMMANVLFGRELMQFRTFGRSLTSCFEVLMGEFDLTEMKGSGRTMAIFWFISFQVIMVLLMINMLIAIILDVYTDVKESSDKQLLDLHAQIFRTLRRWRQNRRGERVTWVQISHGLMNHANGRGLTAIKRSSTQTSLKRMDSTTQPAGCSSDEVVDQFDNLEEGGAKTRSQDSMVLQVSDFMDCVPGLPESQAVRLMVRTVHDFQCQQQVPLTLPDTMRAISEIQNHLMENLDHQSKVENPIVKRNSTQKRSLRNSASYASFDSNATDQSAGRCMDKAVSDKLELLVGMSKRLESIEAKLESSRVQENDHPQPGMHQPALFALLERMVKRMELIEARQNHQRINTTPSAYDELA
eukprot:gnl/MRDRNA2_/MRDRNA2_20331_c0_seq1.p1 gnl/MRDRNA2_/MRDRNA2_20331_c0~~gnl/MRDRNA2_/MRDRNA2_20331_c0_seq1.p1  ORF type:complete len:876 (-),score=112.28 gnl/MRDRNA2_/MRDRNA2_20331_c0_seq1:19-2646(-)